MTSFSTRTRFLTRLIRARSLGRPLTLSHLVTSRCDGRCPTCLWRDRTPGEMGTEAVRWLYAEAGRAGIAHLVVWGGEPLLRADLPELLSAARRAGMATTLISNGWVIGERWPELRGLVDVLILSLDDVGPAHDRLRGLPGLYGRLERFTGALRGDSRRPALLVNMVLSVANRGALGRVAAVARRWDAGLYLCPMETGEMTSQGFVERLADLALPAEELRAVAREARALKDAGLPMLDTRAYLDLVAQDPALSSYTCRAPRAVLTVQPDGVIRDCVHRDTVLADVRALRAAGASLASVFALPRYHEIAAEAAACTACNNPDVVELSWLWDLRPAMLRKVVELAAR
jgi:MoaA/NifB/PqqE/SkfB family radical SAM enzyme